MVVQVTNDCLLVSGVAPCLIAAGVNAYYLWNEHWEHWSHMPPLEERVEYPYQNIRYGTDHFHVIAEDRMREEILEKLTSLDDDIAPRTTNGVTVTRYVAAYPKNLKLLVVATLRKTIAYVYDY